MERIRNLSRYQQVLLLLLAGMMVIFGVVYYFVSTQKGFLYQDHILLPIQENGNTLYSGKIDGVEAVFTVTPDDTVTFRYGQKQYGPYTVTEDPAAVPGDDPRAERMTGIVVRDGSKVLFRGGMYNFGGDSSDFQLFNEDGWYSGLTILATMSDGTVVDGNGNIVDVMEPSLGTILRLTQGPELESKGLWLAWIVGALLSVSYAVSILFADELFRWRMSFQIRDVDRAEPSEWELAGRYIGWTLAVLITFWIYLLGLQ